MVKDIPSISESEWEVMNILWNHAPLTANEVIASLQESTDWKPKTIRTLLDRLVHKDVVGVHKDRKIYTFYPLYSQDECQRAETESFVKRIYRGALKSMLVQFIQEETLSDEDIKELRSILEKNPEKKGLE
ncbi:penicillinase repressor BlaI [Robertmurraya kyonggiensis]|uniref:Penicillinase repressor BlaI n=1 Tax=Robertmurraya kyonggiensis TaxID=1037680 RepID=A0A4U1DAF5_9BACI|nr:penicillinase repressor BlaI [Robertmurraya kyonggiensis]TKC19138.1 penicillinase repressor BlaI [Robertmurraya kyonggiensis]